MALVFEDGTTWLYNLPVRPAPTCFRSQDGVCLRSFRVYTSAWSAVVVPVSRTSSLGDRAFPAAAARAYSEMSLYSTFSLTGCGTVCLLHQPCRHSMHRTLKTHLFTISFPSFTWQSLRYRYRWLHISIYLQPFLRYSKLLVENWDIFIPHLCLAPPQGVTPSEFREYLCIHTKLEWMGYCVVEKAWQYVQPFWYNTSVWRTDRQTDRKPVPKTWLTHVKIIDWVNWINCYV